MKLPKGTLAVLAIVACILCGCSTVSGTRTLPDGSELKVATARWFWASEGIKTTIKDANGFAFTLEVNKSNPHVESIEAVARGVSEGAVKGAKPGL